MSEQDGQVSILAGNSRVYLDEDGKITVEAQDKAFDTALSFARDYQNKHGWLPRISVAFDHHGIFRLQFLRSKLTNSQQRNPRLNHLHAVIQRVFLPIAEKYQIALSDIHVIHEDSARQHIVHILASEHIPQALTRRMLSADNGAQQVGSFCQASPHKLTCAAITKEYFERAAGKQKGRDDVLEVFFEESAWSNRLIYVRGIQLSHMLGVSASIRLNLVNGENGVSRGEIIRVGQ
ncbi:hypothetical protein GW590_00385 [Rahnella sp. SAP-1]|uniref:Uncharacterized protein n=1 Tax=Rouxiella aceris TaxID=2703884 RepID=A0A848MB81_9GAMM|nr:hypothetical protein [Rouxiella aceris]NMP25347.1 hypothetical protein [Rouxiella aceris]